MHYHTKSSPLPTQELIIFQCFVVYSLLFVLISSYFPPFSSVFINQLNFSSSFAFNLESFFPGIVFNVSSKITISHFKVPVLVKSKCKLWNIETCFNQMLEGIFPRFSYDSSALNSWQKKLKKTLLWKYTKNKKIATKYILKHFTICLKLLKKRMTSTILHASKRSPSSIADVYCWML